LNSPVRTAVLTPAGEKRRGEEKKREEGRKRRERGQRDMAMLEQVFSRSSRAHAAHRDGLPLMGAVTSRKAMSRGGKYLPLMAGTRPGCSACKAMSSLVTAPTKNRGHREGTLRALAVFTRRCHRQVNLPPPGPSAFLLCPPSPPGEDLAKVSLFFHSLSHSLSAFACWKKNLAPSASAQQPFFCIILLLGRLRSFLDRYSVFIASHPTITNFRSLGDRKPRQGRHKPAKMMRKILCCANVLPKEKEADAYAKARDTIEDAKEAPIDLIQLPPPAKLSGSNYNFESWLAGNSTGSIASSSRSNVRSPELDFIPDPTSVEYVSDPEDGTQEVVKASNWRRISRSFSQDGSKRSSSPDDEKRFSIPSVNRPSTAPCSNEQGDGEKPPFDQAAYFQAVKSNNKKRLQAEVDSEHSSRSVSTRASNRFRELETVEEDPNDHRDELPGGPRDRIETVMSTEVSALKIPHQPTRPPAAKLSTHGLMVDPTDIDSGDRRRSSCPKMETGSRVMASQLVIRERGSLPLMPPAPILVARQDSDDQDDESFKTWRLSQSIPQGDSQATLTTRTQDALGAKDQTVTISDTKHGTEHQQKSSNAGTELACDEEQPEIEIVFDATSAPVRPLTADSVQSPDRSGWETWLLAEKLTAQDDSIVVQRSSDKNDKCTSAIAGSDTPEIPEKENGVVYMSMSPTCFCGLDNPGNSKATLLVDQKDSRSAAHEALSSTLDMEDKIASAAAESALATEPQYPSSSVYSSTQNTRHASPTGSKDAGGNGDADSLAESLIDLNLAQFEMFNALKEQRSDESYRTAPDQNYDPVVPSIVLPADDAPCDNLSVTSVKYRHKVEMTTNLCGIESQAPFSLSPGDAQEKLNITQNGTQHDTSTRKTSFLQVLRIGKGSGSKGHGKSHSQPSTDLDHLEPSLTLHEITKPKGHAKRLSDLSIRSHMHPISSSTDFTAPKLTESATTVWKRAFQVEHGQREAKSNSNLKKTKIPVRITDANVSHATESDAFTPNKELEVHSPKTSMQLSQSVTSRRTLRLHSLPREPSIVIAARKTDDRGAAASTN
ncbi:hypothetical protein CI238_04329, partial [Colletotrichum incanum]